MFVFECSWLHMPVNIVKLAVPLWSVVYVVHEDTAAVISTQHVAMSNHGNCCRFKHVTLKRVVGDKILPNVKLELLANFIGKGGLLFQYLKQHNELKP